MINLKSRFTCARTLSIMRKYLMLYGWFCSYSRCLYIGEIAYARERQMLGILNRFIAIATIMNIAINEESLYVTHTQTKVCQTERWQKKLNDSPNKKVNMKWEKKHIMWNCLSQMIYTIVAIASFFIYLFGFFCFFYVFLASKVRAHLTFLPFQNFHCQFLFDDASDQRQ